MKYYVGIDIGKREHVACITDEKGKLLRKPITFRTTSGGFNKFLKYLDQVIGEDTYIHIQAGCEATGHYWLTLYSRLKQVGIEVIVLNPLEVKALRNEGIRGNKTDQIDAVKIAKLLRFGEYRTSHVSMEELFELRQLTRLRSDLVNMTTKLKQKIIGIMDQTFPEYDTLFSNTFGTTSKALLAEAKTPEMIAALPTERLTQIIRQASRGRYGASKALSIKEKAAKSIGVKIGIDALLLSLDILLAQIGHIQKQIDELEKAIELRLSKLKTTLTSIPGIGVSLAGTIHAEVGDIERFEGKDGAEKLVALAGLDPKLKESGGSKGKTKMSKRGSSYLRHAVRQAAFIAVTVSKDPMFTRIYNKQKAKGKHMEVALSHVSRKMLHVIYSLMRSGKVYKPKL